MKNFKFTLVGVLLLFTTISIKSFGQTIQRSVICVTGNYINDGSIQVSQTIGEPIYWTIDVAEMDIFAVQGFEQQFNNETTVGLDQLEISVDIYPNPTTDYVYLTSTQSWTENLQVQVFGADGKFYFEETLTNHTKVNLSHLAASTYFLRIINKKDSRYLNAITILKL